MSCGAFRVPNLDWFDDNVANPPNIDNIGIDLTEWEFKPVLIDPYNPPNIDSLTIGAEPDDVPDIPFGDVNSPYIVGSNSITPPSIGASPVLDATKPSIYTPPQPGDFSGSYYGNAPDVTDVTIPDAPEITLPALPTVDSVTMPTAEIIKIPTFSEALPTQNIASPDNTFSFIETDYSSTTLTKATSEISRMLDGGVGIPATTWTLILQQGIEREERGHVKLVEEATKEWAARGWSAPGGALEVRIREAQQAVHNARNTLSRETTIKEAEMELDNLKYAVAQTLALDGMLIQLHSSRMDRALKAAEISVSISIKIMEANIALYNAELQAYQVAATVFAELVKAEIAKVEIYKAELEAVKIGVEVNKVEIDAYVAQIQGLSLAVELHNSQIKGVLAQVEVEKIKVESYAARIRAYSEEVKAWAIEWDGYKTVWDGQQVKANVYETQVKAYAAEVSGHYTKAQIEEIRINAESKEIDLDINRMQADVQRYTAETQNRSAIAESTARTYSARMDGYRAKAAFSSAKASAYQAELNGLIANAKAISDVAISTAQINAGMLEAINRLNLSAAETEAQIQAQIASSTLARLSLSAGMSSSFGETQSYSHDCNS